MKIVLRLVITIIYILLILIVLQTTTFAQAPEIQWTKTFGNSGVVDRGRSVQQTKDGGYIIVGLTEFRGNNNADIWLIKTKANGDTMWTRIFGGYSYDEGSSVRQTSDGGYIITGSTHSFGAGEFDLWLIKTNAVGDSLWTRTYGDFLDDRGNSIDTTLDGGYIIAGNVKRSDPGLTKAWLIKTDSNGDTIWTKTIGDSSNLEGISVQQTNDGGYIMIGSNRAVVVGKQKKHNSDIILDSNIYPLLIKTDSNGNTVWTKTINGINRSWANSMRQTSDGGYIITGVTNSISDLWLIKTDINGDTLWTKTFRDWGEGESVQQTTDGGYIIAESGALIKTDANGDTLWTRKEGGYSVQQTNDGGYIIVGTRFDPGFDVLLIKIASDVTDIGETQQTLIEKYNLWQNYPNPFNPSTTIEFTLPKSEFVELKVYNILGKELSTLVSKKLNQGNHTFTFDGSNLASGVYYYRIKAGNFAETRKMIYLK